MEASEARARVLVIEAVHLLVENHLVERTWGNVSARVDDKHFVITPSGRSYTSMSEEDLPLVNIDDLSWKGPYKPSSEKGIHRDIYEMRSEVGFVIHTHQRYATALSQTDLSAYGAISVPYAISATKKLRKNVYRMIHRHPDMKAFFLARHGAVFMGNSLTDTFQMAMDLEEACRTEVEERITLPTMPPMDLGESERVGDSFIMTLGGKSDQYSLVSRVGFPASLHQAIYKKNASVRYIVPCTSPPIMALARRGKGFRPTLDDLAQSGGAFIPCVDQKDIELVLRGRNTVLIKDCGALAFSNRKSEAEAVAILMDKNAVSDLYSRSVGSYRPLSPFDAIVQHIVYKTKYSKIKED